VKGIYNAKGAFNEKMLIFNDLPSLDKKMNFLRDMVNELSGQLGSAGGLGGDLNFFSQVVNSTLLPYYLIGLDSIPSEVLPPKVLSEIPFSTWALGEGGSMQPMFRQPDRLATVVRERLWSILDQALVLGSRYFRKFFNPDTAFLGASAGIDPNLTVYQSLLNIQGYLVHMHKKLSKDPARHGLILPAITDTIDRFNRVRVAFFRVKELSKALAELDSDNLSTAVARLSKEEKRKWETAYTDLLNRAYVEFNILLQRDTFVANRLSAFVLYDFSDRINRKEDMNENVEDLLRVAGRNLHDRLFGFAGTNPAQVYQDINNGATILKTSLDGYEDIFSDEFLKMTHAYLKKAGGSLRYKTTFGVEKFFQYPSEDTPERSFDQARAKFCIQSLAFKNWQKFTDVCHGAVLYAQPNQAYFEQLRKDQKEKKNPNGFFDRMGRAFSGPGALSQVKNMMVSENDGKDHELQLDAHYDKLVKEREGNDQSYNPVRDSQICALESFNHKSQVYWLTRKFEKTDDSDVGEIARLEAELLKKEQDLEKQLAEDELAKKGIKPSSKGKDLGMTTPALDLGKSSIFKPLTEEEQMKEIDDSLNTVERLRNLGKRLVGPLKPAVTP
jgi:hypothetical protein